MPGVSDKSDFIRTIVREDLESGRVNGVVTRFPPEPNGYLHIGHAKAICLDFGVAQEFGGRCHLRFDDTNPETEDPRYVEAIKQDVRWLGFDWGEHEYYASDYFEQLYEWAVQLIRKGKAYVDDLSEEEIRAYRGTITEPGRESPYRDRPVQENLELFERMRAGEFPDGARVLRAKIDMAHPNMKMRDPLMYRIRHARHYRRGDAWCIYPFYDWAHGQSDAIEGITHSLCTLEFESNRELYDWYLEQLDLPEGVRPRQYEFARLNLDYTVTSKRKLLRLVQEGHVAGWDDPRMPTLAGMRRRGVTAEAIRRFCDLVGVAKAESRVDISMLEYAVRDDLNARAPRFLCVLQPLRVVLTNWPEGRVEEFEAPHWPHDIPKEGSRTLPFGRELFIERDDFMEDPPKGFYRLAPGREVRLRYAYVIRCEQVVRDAAGEIVELRCSYDPATRGGATPDGRRVKGTIHWVSAAHAKKVRVRLYDRLFRVPEPGARTGNYLDDLNPDSLVELAECRAEPALAKLPAGVHVQFERLGYFFTDPEESAPGAPVFNRVVTLRDSWARLQQRAAAGAGAGAAAGADTLSARDGEAAPTARAAAAAARRGKRKSAAQARAEARAADPELASRYERYREEFGLDEQTADLLTGDRRVAELFEAAVAASSEPAAVAAFCVRELPRLAREGDLAALPFDGGALGRLVAMQERGEITPVVAREIFALLCEQGGDPEAIAARRGLLGTVSEARLAALLDELIATHADKFEQLRGGRTGLAGFFVGQVMQRTSGRADPQAVQQLLHERLRR